MNCTKNKPSLKMSIVLIGYRGTGKSSVADNLVERFSAKKISTDELIVQKTGMNIPEIVEKHGWDYFRNVESEVIAEISKQDDLIVDCGGGVILREENVKNLKKNSRIILLTTDINTIKERIKGDSNRPSLTGIKSSSEEIETVLAERKPKYEKAADFIVDTTNLTVEKVAEKIIKYLKM